jgi:hypothetical protein
MSQDFRRSLNKLLDSNPTSGRKENGIEYYKERGHTRTLKVILGDGRQIGLSYHNLISTEYDQADELIILEFTTHIVMLKGKDLLALHEDFLTHQPKVIEMTEERYNLLSEGLPVVNGISVEKANK